MDSRWTQHRDLIQRLYVEERKTLSDVKKELEENHGFPEATLASYEIMIRDKLGLIKKLKKDHWPKLYQQWEERGKRDFDLYDGDSMLYPWKKVWKELRRSRKTQMRHEISLPERLVLRTPPPPPSQDQTLAPSSTHLNSPSQEMGLLPTSFTLANPLPQDIDLPPTAIDSSNSLSRERGPKIIADCVTTVVPRAQVQHQQTDRHLQHFIQAQVETIPWNELRVWLLSSFLGPEKVLGKVEVIDGHHFALIPHDGFSRRQPGQMLARISDTTFPMFWDLERSLNSATAFTHDAETYFLMLVAIHIFSNYFLSEFDDSHRLIAKRFLDLLQFTAPRKYLRQLLQGNALSVRAAWRSLLCQSIYIRHQKGFIFLVDTALGHHPSLIEEDNLYLAMVFSIGIGEIKLLRRLIGLVPIITGRDEMRSYYAGCMVASALKHGSIDCAKLIIQSFNVNLSDTLRTNGIPLINFMQFLIQTIAGRQKNSCNTRLSLDSEEQKVRDFVTILDLYLEEDAQLNLPYVTCGSSDCPIYNILENVLEAHPEWRPTCLEAILYLNIPVFNYLLQQQGPQANASMEPTRSGIYLAASDGIDSLMQYLNSEPANYGRNKNGLLEMILIEQFIPFRCSYLEEFFSFTVATILASGDFQLRARVARGLMEYGVSPGKNIFGEQEGPNRLLVVLLNSIDPCDLTDDTSFLLQRILEDGASFSPVAMSYAVRERGIEILEFIQLQKCEIKEMGADSLAEAALLGNVEAVEWLLRNGVDGNAETAWTTNDGTRLTVIGAIFHAREATSDDFPTHHILPRNFPCRSSTPRLTVPIVQRLIQTGTRLRVTQCDQNPPLEFLLSVLRYRYSITNHNIDEYKGLVWYLATLPETDKMSPEEWHQFLIKLMGSVSGGYKKFWGLFESLLKRYCNSKTGPFLSAFIELEVPDELVQMALSMTTDINDYLLSVHGPITPIQAASHLCNERLVTQLFNQGANINTSRRGCRSPLSKACSWNPVTSEESQRQRNIIKFLLDKGADVNDAVGDNLTALDYCVLRGDMHHVTLLLQHGADPNRINHRSYHAMSALDWAIFGKRLDIAKLLLNIGALSGIPGVTGYDLAITQATDCMAELLEHHLVEKNKLLREHPKLRSTHDAIVNKQNALCCELLEKAGKCLKYTECGLFYIEYMDSDINGADTIDEFWTKDSKKLMHHLLSFW